MKKLPGHYEKMENEYPRADSVRTVQVSKRVAESAGYNHGWSEDNAVFSR
jgi:hypothetical protein